MDLFNKTIKLHKDFSKNKLLLNITTCDKNISYLKNLIDSLMENTFKIPTVILILDYSKNSEAVTKFLEPLNIEKENLKFIYLHRPDSGFCRNINTTIALAYLTDVKYVGHMNDDIIISENTINKLLNRIKNDIVFCSGVQQEGSEVQISSEDLKKIKFPKNEDRIEVIKDTKGKWGDFSLWIAKQEVLRKVGKLDEAFDPVGILADNDMLFRLRKTGYKAVRDYNVRYLHAKGVTQRTYREGFPKDKVLMKARIHFFNKWNMDVYSGDEGNSFEFPFNKKPVSEVETISPKSLIE